MAEAIDSSRRATLGAFSVIALGWAICAYLYFNPANDAGTVPVLGIGLAAWGMLYFAAIGFLLTLRNPRFTAIAFVVAAMGFGASLRLAVPVLSGLVSLCPLCLLVPVAAASLVILLWTLSRTAPLPWASAKTLAAVGLTAIVAGAAIEYAVLSPGRSQARQADPAAVWDQYLSSPRQELTAEADDPVLGPKDGAIRMVVFSSFGCSACLTFSPVMHRLHDRFGDNLTIVFKHYPLSNECNPALRSDMQPRSCEAAWAAEAANRQQAFWSFHDRLFRSDLKGSEQTLRQIARETNLDQARWDADRISNGARLKVQQGVELGVRLQIDGTPSVFLNGRRVRTLAFQELEFVIARLFEQSDLTKPTLQSSSF